MHDHLGSKIQSYTHTQIYWHTHTDILAHTHRYTGRTTDRQTDRQMRQIQPYLKKNNYLKKDRQYIDSQTHAMRE